MKVLTWGDIVLTHDVKVHAFGVKVAVFWRGRVVSIDSMWLKYLTLKHYCDTSVGLFVSLSVCGKFVVSQKKCTVQVKIYFEPFNVATLMEHKFFNNQYFISLKVHYVLVHGLQFSYSRFVLLREPSETCNLSFAEGTFC